MTDEEKAKQARREYTKEWRKENRDHVNEYHRNWYKDHKEQTHQTIVKSLAKKYDRTHNSDNSTPSEGKE